MNDLWIHYTADIDPHLDRDIKRIVESNGGKWFGSGMNIDSAEGRDNSFTFNRHSDFESAVGDLAKAFKLEWMRTTGEEGSYSCHYRVS